jgi:YfiH family protein
VGETAASSELKWLTPDWPAPAHIRALTSLRGGGVSAGEFASLNLARHVGDDPAAVSTNRRRLIEAAALPAEPLWLDQVHGVTVVDAGSAQEAPQADASIARRASKVCTIMTADCLPVLFCDIGGTRVGAAHAGWRGLVSGVLAATVRALDVEPSQLLAWLGPAIEQTAFEVGTEVREQFMARDAAHAGAFVPNTRGRWQADLYQLARQELRRSGVTQLYGGGFSCFADSERFFSFRRSPRTGRMASLIWIS